ncbi:putative multiple PDZ domain protein-like [Apostichopus japonicus]|uniref:Putative multiple PDZ domain protein-like n=1 Tax=Stichopus japonicus TaxID=307972 RepID=A0A2G8KT06_STIJA|nr:putative multiple PDZ domain protein-like [Apostichopus japonicus]
MAVVADTQQAVAILNGIQGRLEDSGDVALSQQVAVMIKLLDSPSFKQLLNLQQAIRQLKDHISATPPGKQSTDFDFSPDGELVLPHEEPKEESEPESPGESHPFAFENVTFQPDEETITPTVAHEAASAPTLPARSSPMWIAITDPRLTELAFNRELVAVDLIKPESGGLGFTVVGLNSKTHGDLGIFIQKIQPESVAARDGRLRESDQILVINDQILDAGVSHKDAIGMLHKIQGQVYLIIARGDFDLPPPSELQPMEQTQQEVEETDQAEVESEGIDEVDTTPEIRTIELTNDGNGLGFGIVGVHNTGIVVKTIVKDGVAARDGRLESGDIILQIGDTSLKGMNSTEVASVLRQSGSHVKLTVVKKGISVPPQQLRMPLSEEPKVEKLEETQEEAAPPLPVTSPPPDVAVDTPKIDLDVFEVELQKTSQGLGLSIAGFEENRPDGVDAGIFVKGIADGSAAALSQKIRVGDQIIEVDSQPVHGFGNRQAVELLRRTGSLVHLKLARRKKRNNTSIDVPTTIPEKETEMEPENAEPKDDEKMKVQQPEENGETDVAREEEEEEEQEQEEEKTDKEKEEMAGEEGKEDNEGDDIGMALDEQLEAAAVAGVMAAVVMEEKKEDKPRIEEDEMEEPRPTVTPVVIEQQKTEHITYPKTSPAMVSRKDPSVQIALWQSMLGPMVTILVSDVKKDGSLGIVLEGRVDIDEHGQEIQPRHYISTVVSDGPVGKQGLLAPGDELLEVNGIRLYGRNHEEVVDILRSLPSKVHLICGCHDRPPTVIKEDLPSQREVEEVIPEVVPHVESARLPISPEPEVKESVVAEEEAQAMEETLTVISGDSDPLKPENNVILIRSLVDGGIAEQDGRLIPGDRLMSVNDIDLESATLEAAVEAALAQQTKEEEDKRRTIDQEAPVVAMTTSVAHAVAPGGRNNPPDLIADGPPKPAPRKSLSNSPPPEPSHPPPSLPAPMVVPSASITLQQRPTYIELPEALEKTLVLKNTNTGLGMTVSADQANGAIVKSILRGGCIHEDGTLSVGDNITAINGDSTRNMTNSAVRGLLRKCFFGGSEISITYISASDAAAYRDQLAGNLASPDSEEEMWQDIRWWKSTEKPENHSESAFLEGFIDGIFIKHVLEDSPAGKTGDLKTGDRILEVNDCDLREATHDQAVAIIKNAPNPVKFKVQSLSPELQPSYVSQMRKFVGKRQFQRRALTTDSPFNKS